jgi:predicted CXXCH cytochrome family protein
LQEALMEKHVLRPFWVLLAAIILILLIRQLMVPDDFGIHGKNFTYGYHRLGNIEEWKNFPVKYSGGKTCLECHPENTTDIVSSRHKNIQCENCHGPATGHPDNTESLPIERDRQLCLRCHAILAYPTSQRAAIKGITSEDHNPELFCGECHNPHRPDLEGM